MVIEVRQQPQSLNMLKATFAFLSINSASKATKNTISHAENFGTLLKGLLAPPRNGQHSRVDPGAANVWFWLTAEVRMRLADFRFTSEN